MKTLRLAIVLIALSVIAAPVLADRLKDLARIKGVRNNQLVGYGLVVGLDGTGDSAPFTNQTFRNMMDQFGVTLPPGVNPNLDNVAAVTVTAPQRHAPSIRAVIGRPRREDCAFRNRLW
jgi:flagellar P-ring protein precursor FlgI